MIRALPRREALAGLAAAALPSTARAADAPWPTHPIRMIVPFAPGGQTDVWARLLANHLGAALGQPCVVENRAGATGAIGTAAVARAAPDGATLLFTSNSALVIAPLLAPSPGFDPGASFAPVGALLSYAGLLVINPALPAHSLAEFVAYARASPGRLSYASPGAGGGGHLMAEMFRQEAGLEAVHVPYSGSGPALLAIAAGEVQFGFDTVAGAAPLIGAGRLRGLAVTSLARARAVPDLPTLAEAGLGAFDATIWLGLLGPAGTPAPVIATLNGEIARFLALPDTRARLEAGDLEPTGGAPAELAERIRSDGARWAEVIERAGLRATVR